MKKTMVRIGLFISTNLFFIFALSCTSCQKNKTNNSRSPIQNPPFAKGADISWTPQMESAGYKFLNTDGTLQDVIDILKSKGIENIRLRVFVNPSTNPQSGYCGKKDVAKMAQRAHNKQMKIMIDFHYSDSWADPSKQTKPDAWATHNFEQLKTDVYNHTYEILDTLKILGITPQWVQIGNEITNGMLWPDAKVAATNNWDKLAQLLNKGYDAVKAIDNNIKVIIHIDKGNNNSQARWFFDNIKNNNVNYDIIGFSYYPYWLLPEGFKDYKSSITDLKNNLNDMISRYKKPVMIVETGEVDNQPQEAYNMLVDVIKMINNLPDEQGLGVFYWEPQGARSWSQYALSAWGNNKKPTKALDAFNTTTK